MIITLAITLLRGDAASARRGALVGFFVGLFLFLFVRLVSFYFYSYG